MDLREKSEIYLGLGILLCMVLIVFILTIEHRQQQPEIKKEYESLVIEQEKIRQCVEAHYPVDLNLDDWHGCLREKGLLR